MNPALRPLPSVRGARALVESHIHTQFSGPSQELVAAGAASVALAFGGYAIADSSSSNGVSSSASTAVSGKVIPFQRGVPGSSKKVGQIPASWTAGSGTLVSGQAANKAKAAAEAAFKGGTVDRVVRLSNGEYNVHIIGVNWPHHVFVSKNFKVVGAE
jgi:hypothetical protein